jgi:hypothetical protein
VSQLIKEGSVDEQAVAAWLDGYSRAWKTYDPEQIGELFSEDADEEGTYEGRYRPVLVAGDQAVANGYSRYFDGDGGVAKEFDNLILLRFDTDGRCVEYREWYMRKPDEEDG